MGDAIWGSCGLLPWWMYQLSSSLINSADKALTTPVFPKVFPRISFRLKIDIDHRAHQDLASNLSCNRFSLSLMLLQEEARNGGQVASSTIPTNPQIVRIHMIFTSVVHDPQDGMKAILDPSWKFMLRSQAVFNEK